MKIKRKFTSFLKKLYKYYVNIFNRFKIFLLEENITLGKNIYIGKNTIIKTTDGGKIIIKNNVSIESNCYIYAQKGTIVIENNNFIGFGSQIVAKESIYVGANCLISAYSIIRDANHGIKRKNLIFSQPHVSKAIIIKNDVWIGSHSVITAGVIIGEGVVAGANAVITKNIDDYLIVGGVPAKFIKYRN